jgi:hypothetical protein
MQNIFRILVLTLAVCAPLWAQDPLQKLNLPATTVDRFPITDRVWPATHGQASVCLWDDDKLAAASVAIDDNTLPNHDWWIGMGEKYGFKFTWFVIVWPYMYNYDGSAGTNQGYYGTAAAFKRLFDLGHDVQAHGTGTINAYSDSAYEYDLLFTKRILEDSIPGNKCIVYAYPSGVATKSAVAARHYIGSRGTTGAVDRANRVNYLNTGDGGISADNLANMLDNRGSNYWRGWTNDLSHLITTQPDSLDKQAQLDAKERSLQRLYARRDSLWVAPFRRVALYSQSYATHTLNVLSATGTEIQFALTDSMADSVFDAPLTVKVRLDSSWDALTVRQNGTPIAYTVMLRNGAKYALVKAVPDQGTVVMTKIAPTTTARPVITPREGTYRDTARVTMTCVTSDAEVRYTLDHSTPDQTDALYTGPFPLTRTAVVKARAFKTGLTAGETDSVSLTVTTDSVPPTVTSAAAVGAATSVVVSFSEEVLASGANVPGNYTITPGITVSAAVLAKNSRAVTLTTSALAPATPYTLHAANVRDSSGNAVSGPDAQFTFQPAAAESGLYGYWSFDEGDAAVAIDHSGHGNTGAIFGAAIDSGRTGPALRFNGAGDYVNIGPSDFGMAATGKMTIAFWFKSLGGWGGTFADSRNYYRPYTISAYYAGRKITTSLRTTSTGSVNSVATFTVDTWYHFAVTYTDSHLIVYVNGQPDVTGAQTGALATSTTVDDYIGTGFYGLMDELRIYNRALSAAEINTLAGGTVPVTVEQSAVPAIAGLSVVNPVQDVLRVTGRDIVSVALYTGAGVRVPARARRTDAGWSLNLPPQSPAGMYVVKAITAQGMRLSKCIVIGK